MSKTFLIDFTLLMSDKSNLESSYLISNLLMSAISNLSSSYLISYCYPPKGSYRSSKK